LPLLPPAVRAPARAGARVLPGRGFLCAVEGLAREWIRQPVREYLAHACGQNPEKEVVNQATGFALPP